MPSLREAIAADLSGYTSIEASTPNVPAPSENFQPGRSSMMRCPLPILGAATPDALRSFYLDGQVPQVRLLTPQPSVATASASTTTTTASGGSSSSSEVTTLSVSQATITTPVLSPNAKYTGSITLSKSFQLLSLAVNQPSRVELYGTSTAQSSDLGRGVDVPPAAGTAQNVICDVVLDTLPYQWSFQNRTGANGNTPQTASIYVTIANLAATSAALTVTLVYVPLVK